MRRAAVCLAATLLVAACGTQGGQPTEAHGLPKPADPATAFADAYARTASFHDVSVRQRGTSKTNGVMSTLDGTIQATSNPAEIETKVGQAESIVNYAAGVDCFYSPQAGHHRYQVGANAAANVNPLQDLLTYGGAWAYAGDTTLNGHAVWHLTGKVTVPQAPSPAPILTYTVNAVDVFINAASGRIEEVRQHTVVSEGSSTTERSVVLSEFVYDHGVTIGSCT